MAPRDYEDIQGDLPVPTDNPSQPIGTKKDPSSGQISYKSESPKQSNVITRRGWRLRVVVVPSWLRDRWGWLVTLATFVIFLVSYGFFACYGLLFVAFQKEFNSGATATGWIGSLQIAVAHLSGPLTNYLVSKLRSPRRVVLLGNITCFIGLLASSFVPSVYYLFVTIGIVCGLGLNMMSQATLVLIVQYFHDKNSSRAISLACIGPSIGMLILSPIVNHTIEAYGWRVTLRYFGAVILVVGSLCSLPMLPVGHKTRNMQQYLTKGDMNGKEDGRGHSKLTKKPSIGSLKSGNMGSSNGDGRTLDHRASLTTPQRSLPRQGKFWVLCVGIVVTSVAQTFYNINYVSYLQVLGIPADKTAIMVTLYAAGQITGEILLSLFADKLYNHNVKLYVISFSCILCGLATIPMLFVSASTLFTAISIVLGFLRAPRTVLIIPTAIEMFGVSHVQEVTSAILLAHGVGFAMGASVMGATFDGTGSYELSIAFCISLLIIACFMYISVPLRSKFRRSKQSITALHHHIIVDQSSDEEPECHLKPIPNLVAPIGGIIPFLVASQESLNQLQNDDDIVHRRDLDRSNSDLSSDLAQHPIRVRDIQVHKRDGDIETPLSNSLIMKLTDVAIYLSQNSKDNLTERSNSTDCLLTQSDVDAVDLDSKFDLDISGENLLNNFINEKSESQSGTPQSQNEDGQIIPTPDEPLENQTDDQSCTGTNYSDGVPNSSWDTPPHISMIENPLIGCLDDRATIERFHELHDNWLSPTLVESPQRLIFDDWVDSNGTSNAPSPEDCTIFDELMMSEQGTQTEQSSVCEGSDDFASVIKDSPTNESDNYSYDLEEATSSSYDQPDVLNTINEQIKAMKEIFNQFNTYDDSDSVMSPSVASVDSNGVPEVQMVDFSIDNQEVTYKSYSMGI